MEVWNGKSLQMNKKAIIILGIGVICSSFMIFFLLYPDSYRHVRFYLQYMMFYPLLLVGYILSISELFKMFKMKKVSWIVLLYILPVLLIGTHLFAAILLLIGSIILES